MIQKLKLLKNIKSGQHKICVIPWISLNIQRTCKVFHCCLTSDFKTFAGDLAVQSMEEVWNSEVMRSIRRSMINGEEHPLCSSCYEVELHSGISTRYYNNRFSKNHLLKIPFITRPDGSVNKVNIQYWDFRFSNVCNYTCRICSHWNSTSWIPDAKELGWYDKSSQTEPYQKEALHRLLKWALLPQNLKVLKKIYFSGGEPLLMDEHWQILEALDKEKRYDVILSYNSNLGSLSYKNTSVIDYWKKWGEAIWLWPSIDEIGVRAELIRKGTDWSTVETNLKKLKETGIHIRPAITVSAMNVFRIPEIIYHLVDMGIIGITHVQEECWRNFTFNIVTDPPNMHVSVLPDEMRKNVLDKLNTFIIEYEQKHSVKIREIFNSLLWHLEKPWEKEHCEDFKKFMLTLDRIRGENTLTVIPELQCVFTD